MFILMIELLMVPYGDVKIIDAHKHLQLGEIYPLGNTGGIIQIEESHLFGAKYNLENVLFYKQLCFFSAIDDLTNRVSIEKCDSWLGDDLVPMIMSMCNSGSTIWSDIWKSYNNLNLYGFHYSNVNHKKL